MQLPKHNMWICGSPGRELDRKEKNLVKENKMGSWVMFLRNLVCLLLARLWLYKEPHHRTLVAKERKEGAKRNKRLGSGNNNGTRDHLSVLCVVRGIR